LKKILIDEDVTFQGFVSAASAAMIDGDARMTQIVRAWKTEREIPHEERSRYILSKRERDSLLEELEKPQATKPTPPPNRQVREDQVTKKKE
jgi:hypothetical protein